MIDDWCVLPGDCRDRLADLDAESIDAVVTDPPYELGFMGKEWDKSGVPYQTPTWAAVLGVLKPGGHLLAFGGTRTYHRMTCAIEDAGFEIRDCLQWIYGSGFPKSLDVSKAIDREAGAERQVVGPDRRRLIGGVTGESTNHGRGGIAYGVDAETAPATPAAQQWQGWGTALKPAYEPIVLARKPLIGTVAQNVQQYGTGAINVDGCRVATSDGLNGGRYSEHGSGEADGATYGVGINRRTPGGFTQPLGRWPANIILDGSEEVVALFPQTQTNATGSGGTSSGRSVHCYGVYRGTGAATVHGSDRGSAARFFYTAKASRSERGADNTHPTVKPLALMRYLVRLITPPDGLVLDPFTGSGTTGIAAILEQKRFIGIELEAETAEKAERRIRARVDLPLFAESLAK